MGHATTIVGYTYAADLFCPDHILDQFTGDDGLIYPDNPWAEENLDAIAAKRGIDRYNENSFDSDDFPKVVFGDYDGPGQCSVCAAYLGVEPDHDDDDLPEDAYVILGVAGDMGSLVQLVGARGEKKFLLAADHRMAQAIIEHLCDEDYLPVAHCEAWAVTPLPDDFDLFVHPNDMEAS